MLIRDARRDDLPEILGLFVDDVLGRARDHATVDADYERAFEDIDSDPRNQLVVVEDDGRVIATLQITYIPGLARHGAERSLLENVHVASARRGERIGQTLITWAVEQARERGCRVVQLTTDKSRADAHRFYERLGFVATHEGMKLIV